MAQITIVGMGLIGTSIGLALKTAKVPDVKVVGFDVDNANSRQAYKKLALDNAEGNLRSAVKNADLLIIATPVSAIRDVLEEVGQHLPEQCAVTDTGSTKYQVLKWAEELLPKHINFIGGHPMAGKETSGPDAGEASLFKGKVWCVTPSVKAADWSVEAVMSLIQSVGARPYFMDPQEHDSFVAAVSHMPIALSAALVGATSKSPSWHEIALLASSGYRDVSRLASGDPKMNRDIYITNGEAIGGWLDRAIAELLLIRKALHDKNEEALAKYFTQVHDEREKWTTGAVLPPAGAGSDVKVPSTGQQLTSLLLGEMLANKGRRVMDDYDKRDGKGKKDGF